MDLFSRMQITLKHTSVNRRYANSVSKMLEVYAGIGQTVSRRTITRDFLRLEADGLLCFSHYDGLAKLYCRPKTSKLSCSENLAWLLTSLEQPLRKLCSDEMLVSVEAELAAAKVILDKFSRNHPQSSLSKFTRKLEPVANDIAKSGIPSEVLKTIKEALWDESFQIEVKQDGLVSPLTMNNVTLKKINNKLYLCGRLAGNRMSVVNVLLETVESAKISEKMLFQRKCA